VSAQNPYGVLHFTRNSEGGVLGFSKELFLSSAQNPYGILHFTSNSKGGVLGFSNKLFLSRVAYSYRRDYNCGLVEIRSETMNDEQSPMPIKSDDTNVMLAWFQEAARQGRLAWRLFWDSRVPSWTKVIPPAALAYVIFPLDIIPDVALGLGQLDDLAVLLLGLKLFIEVAPPDVVREHLRALGARIEEWRVVEEEEPPVVIDGEYQLQEPGEEEKSGGKT